MYPVAGLIALVYLGSELLRRYLQGRETLARQNGGKERTTLNLYEIFILLVCLGFVSTIPILWIGVIKKLAVMANEVRPR